MAGETFLTIYGNLTADPELRYTPSNVAVVNFNVASNPRAYDRKAGEWKDGDPVYMRCSLWRDHAENVAASLKRGMRVIVHGVLKQRSYEKDGQRRTAMELEVVEVGPALRYATAQVTKASRGPAESPQPPADANQAGNGWATASTSDAFGGGVVQPW